MPGGAAIACSREPRRECSSCGAWVKDGVLCDYVFKGGKTCDRHCCRKCATSVGENRDYCPPHARVGAGPVKTTVVNIHREPFDVYIGRAGRGHDGVFGNPVVPGEPCPVCGDLHGDGGDTLACFTVLFERAVRDPSSRAKIEELRGKRLGCFCKPKPCHGDVIADYLNARSPDILLFSGEHRFLSNFWPCEVRYGDVKFNSVEAAYQAAKCASREEVLRFQHLGPKEAKRLGRSVRLRDDWERVKLGVMQALLEQKFASGSDLARRLVATHPAALVEGNWWGDKFWGVCDGEGENHLGRLLMLVRAALLETTS